MSAPQSHDPLTVATADGGIWERRAVSPQGRGLYALAGSLPECPQIVVATLTELAEYGIRPVTDVASAVAALGALPMPAGPVPSADVRREDVYRSPLHSDYSECRDLPANGPWGDPLAYGPTGVRCGCGKDAHSNLVPCQPDLPEVSP
ncbi:hypothetical protein [Streptomyces sp. NPDC056543]|uniref:hypothetical protein n=1 Tax=unclassified Streptomyces TaxID=2593676 RepID=UPI00369F84AF